MGSVMGGDVSMEDSLEMTARLLEVTKEKVDRYMSTHEGKWNEGIEDLIGYLQSQGKAIYVVSGGVEEV